MFQSSELMICFLVPALAAAVLSVTMRQSLRERWFEASVGVGYIVGHFMITAHDELMTRVTLGQTSDGAWGAAILSAARLLIAPRVARDWIPGALVVALLVLRFAPESFAGRTRRWPTWLWLGVFLLFALRLLWGSVYLTDEWTIRQASWRLAAIALAMWLPGQVTAIGPATRPRVSALSLLSLVAVAAAIGMSLLLSGSKTYGLHGLITSSAITGAALAELTSRQPGTSRPRIVPMLMGAWLVLGMYFAELQPWHANLLYDAMVFAVLPLFMPELLKIRRQQWVCSFVALALALSAVGFGARQFLKDSQPNSLDANPYEAYSMSAEGGVGGSLGRRSPMSHVPQARSQRRHQAGR